ncbi:E3 ubiquitin-protein ligase CHIP-like [Drosophila kikkawai]|uniref:E3 ubiquitin-protein ligase CHIP n=1 Tax=Drosophila kikkawai TaxID=30033 RepID=A0A6P4J1H2_DROKI|nr:E3 ubiquitin-protein ligase CHIP-like [Drosophila kikkawai]
MTSRRTLFTAKLREKQLKRQGDRLFKAHKFEDALKSYSAAVNMNPTNYKHLMDRAKCYKNLNQWELFVQDWRRALNFKGNMLYVAGILMGAELVQANNSIEEVATYLKAARIVTKREVQRNSNGLFLKLERARKNRWLDLESREINQEKELVDYMNKLIKFDKKIRLGLLKKIKNNLPEDEVKAKRREIQKTSTEKSKQLSKIFEKLKERRKKREIPDYLLCPISFGIFKNPVITPCGITYERKSIVKHLKQGGPFDPVTRTELTEEQLIPNRAIMNAVDSFLAENEWARHE